MLLDIVGDKRMSNYLPSIPFMELGLDSIFVTDHMLRARNMYARTWLEPMTSLAFAAAVTSKSLLGPGVLLLPLRNPVLLAKECGLTNPELDKWGKIPEFKYCAVQVQRCQK